MSNLFRPSLLKVLHYLREHDPSFIVEVNEKFFPFTGPDETFRCLLPTAAQDQSALLGTVFNIFKAQACLLGLPWTIAFQGERHGFTVKIGVGEATDVLMEAAFITAYVECVARRVGGGKRNADA